MRLLTQLAVKALDAVLPARDEPEHIRTGRRGEELAYFYLRKAGYTIVARNYRSPWHKSEIDMVGWDCDTLCFVEVKTRTTRDVATAEAAVDTEKQKDLSRIARHYLRRERPETPSRFDIVTVYLDRPRPEITLFKNAFSAS